MEENTPLTITPYYWRNRERVLKSIAEKKATPEGRKAYNEYQRAYQKRYKARKLAVAKEIANLGISESQAQQTGLKDALTAIIEQEKVGVSQAALQPTTTVATTTPSGLLGLLGIGGGTTTTTKTPNAGTWN